MSKAAYKLGSPLKKKNNNVQGTARSGGVLTDYQCSTGRNVYVGASFLEGILAVGS